MPATPSPPSPSPSSPEIDLALSLVDGRGVVGLRSPWVAAPAALERLELEVPELRSPFDLSGGAGRLRTRRLRLREARVAIDEAEANAWLRGRPLADYGIDEPSLRIDEGALRIAFRASAGDRAATGTARLRLAPSTEDPRRLRLRVEEVRLYGFLPVPAPLVGMALLLGASGAGAGDGRAPSLRGVDELELSPLELLLWRALVPSGWRLPSRAGARIVRLLVGGGRVELGFGDGEPAAAELPGTACPDGDAALARNDLDGALAAYEAAFAAAPDPRLVERMLAIRVASPAGWEAARALATAAPSEERVASLLALAAIEAERGEPLAAGARYQALAERLATDEPDDARVALLRAAELYLSVEPARVLPLLERLADAAPSDARTAALLDAARGRIAAAATATDDAELRALVEEAARARAAGELAVARATLERALARREDPSLRVQAAEIALATGDGDGAARHLDAAGERPDALLLRAALDESRGDEAALDDTLARLVRVAADPATRARAVARQAGARVRRGLLAEALRGYREALALLPTDGSDDADAIRAALGRTAYQLGEWTEARAAWEPLHDRGVPPRAQRALRLGEISLRLRDPAAAARYYRSALELGVTGSDAVEAYDALVAVADGRGDVHGATGILVEAAGDRRTGESHPVRAGRLVAAAGRLLQRGDREGARGLYEVALSLDAEHRTALDALESLALQAREPDRIADVLARKAEAARHRPQERVAILTRLAELQSEELGRPDAARETCERLLDLDPKNAYALQHLLDGARRAGDRREELRLLERRLRPPPHPPARDELPLQVRLAQLHAEEGRLDEAERQARRALDVDPRDPAALALLDELLSRRERWVELEPLLGRRAEVESSFERGIDLAYRRATVLERLGRRDEAIAAYDRIVRVRPSAAAAWERLTALHREAGSWRELLDVLGRVAGRHGAAGERAEAAAVLVEMAHLAVERLGDGQAARRSLERALDWDPRCALALEGLVSLARAAGDAREEDALLGRRIDVEEDPARREALRFERARARRQRGDLDGARELLRAAPIARASDDGLRLRAELAEEQGDWSDAAAALEERARRAREAGDVDGERELLGRLAPIVWTRLRHRARAEALFRRALELGPDDVEAATELVAIERERGEPAGLLEALEALRRALGKRPHGPERDADVAVEIARLLRQAGDAAGAAARLRETLAAQPERAEALRLLGETLLDLGEAERAVELLERARALSSDPAIHAALARAFDALGEPERAAAAWDAAGDAGDPARRAEALERTGRETEALAAWRAIASSAASAASVEEARRRAAALLLRWARAAQVDDRPADAARLAAEALVEGPCEPDALALATADSDGDAVRALVERAAARLPPVEAARLWRAAAALLPSEMARGALERAVAAAPDAEALAALARLEGGESGADRARAALAIDPGCVAAALALASLSRSPDVLPALRAAHRRATGGDRAALSVAVGVFLRDHAHEPAGARDAFRRALDEGAAGEAAATARRALAALDVEIGDLAGAESELRALGAAATADDLRALAGILGARGAHDEAIEALRAAGGPASALAHAYEAAERWTDAVAALEQSANESPPHEARVPLLRAASISEERLGDRLRAIALLERALATGPVDGELWVRLGRLYAAALGDPHRAAVCFARAHAVDPGRGEVLVPLGDYHFARRELAPAEDYYRKALERPLQAPLDGEALAERARLRLRLAEIAGAGRRTDDEERELAAAAADGSLEAWERLAARYRDRGEGARLAETLLGWAARDPARRHELLRQALPLVDPERAAAIDDELVRANPADDEARARLLARLRSSGDEAALARRLADELPRAPLRSRPALALELAAVCERLGDDEGAFAAWRSALSLSPSVEGARSLLAVARRARRGAEAALAIEAAFGDAIDAAPLVAEAWLAPGGDRERAVPWIERALVAGQSGADVATWRAMLRAVGRFTELVAELDAEAVRGDGDERLRLELEAAELVEDQLGDPRAAAERYARAWRLERRQRDVAAHARALFLGAGEPAAALALLDEELASLDGAAVEPPLRIARSEALLALGRFAEAEAELQAVLARDPGSGPAHAALADLALRLGRRDLALPHLLVAAEAHDLDRARAARAAFLAALELGRRGDPEAEERLLGLGAALDPACEALLGALPELRAEDPDAALDVERRLLGLLPEARARSGLRVEHAALLEARGRRDEAWDVLRVAVEEDPGSLAAAAALRREAEARGEWALVAELLRRELDGAPPGAEKAERLVELARIAEERLGDASEALRRYEEAAALGAPRFGDVARLHEAQGRAEPAAQALARHAESLAGPAREEALRRVAELRRRSPRATPAVSRTPIAPMALAAGGALTELEPPGDELEQAFRRRLLAERDPRTFAELVRRRVAGATDPAASRRTLRAVLDRLPLDAVEKITELRQRLGDLSRRLGDPVAARNYYELVLAQYPERVEVLRPLVELYAAAGEWARSAEMLGRLAYLAPTAQERAELTFRQAELYRVQLGDDERAGAGYLKAADYYPDHAPTLLRLVPYYFAEGEIDAAVELVDDLEERGVALAPVAIEAGLAVGVAGDEARALALLAGARPEPLAAAVAAVRARDKGGASPAAPLALLDASLRVAARALGGATAGPGDPAGLSALGEALEARLVAQPAHLGARTAAARLAQLANDVGRARAHLAVLAWIEPGGWASRQLAQLPPPGDAPLGAEPVHPGAASPLREALRLLGPLTVGVGAPLPGAVAEPAWADHLRPLAMALGFASIEVATVTGGEGPADPAWAEPTRPPRLLVRLALLEDEAATLFATARALHLLRAGVPLVEERPEEELAALLAAAYALVRGAPPEAASAGATPPSLVQAWYGALRPLLDASILPPNLRDALEAALAAAARPGVAAGGTIFCLAERLTADRVAFLVTADLGAGLRALAPDLTALAPPEGPAARAQSLADPGPVRELVTFALSPEGRARLAGLA